MENRVDTLMIKALNLSEYIGLVFPVHSFSIVSVEEREVLASHFSHASRGKFGKEKTHSLGLGSIAAIAIIRVNISFSVLQDQKREITVDIPSTMNAGEVAQFSLNIMAKIAKELVVSKMEKEFP